MALVAVPGGLWIPDYQFWAGAASSAFVAALLDAAADRVGVVFRVPKTGNLSKIKVRIGTVPALGGTTTLTVGIQDVDLATGNPDDVFNQSATVPNASIVANTTVTVTLGAVEAVTKGQLRAVVIQYGTFNTGDQVNINRTMSGSTRQFFHHFGYAVENLAGTYTKVGNVPSISLEYDDGSYAYIPECYPVMVNGTVAFNSGSINEKIGLKFQVPFPCKIGGAWLGIDSDGDFDLIFYDAAGSTNLGSWDTDVRISAVGQTSGLLFNSEVTLVATTNYVLAVVPTSVTNVTLHFLDVAVAAELDQRPGGQNFHYAVANAPTTVTDFTATTTRVPMIGLLVTAVDDGVSAGGGIRLAGHGGLAA